MDYGEFLSRLFTTVWHVFTDLRLPVIGLTFAELYIGTWVVILGVYVIHHYLSFGSRSSGSKMNHKDGKKYTKRG